MMKKTLALCGVLLLVVFIAPQFISYTMAAVTKQDIKIEKLHNIPLAIPPLAVVSGDSVYISSLELKGKWEELTQPAHPWPYEAFQWLDDDNADNPLATLDWTGVMVDTTWGVGDLGAGVGKYTIDKKTTQEYKAGKFLAPTLTGWLAPTNAYTIEVYTVKSATATFVKSLPFNPAAQDTAFSGAKWEVAYKAEGRGAYPTATPARPNELINAKGEAKIQLTGGLISQWFLIPDGTDSLRLVFKSQISQFASVSVPVSITTKQQLGLTPSVVIKSATPASGYFSAGDTLDVEITLKNDSGDVLEWWTNPQVIGLEKLEILASGPKRDYEWVFPLRSIVEKFVVKYDSVQGKLYSGNPVKLVLPKTLPNGNGTYTIFVNAKRIFGTTVEKAIVVDFQVGTTAVDNLPVSSTIAGQSCAACHGVNGPAKHHGAKGAEQCLPCHTDNFKVGFDQWTHVKHQNNPKVAMTLGDCNACHVNDSHNQFTSDAQEVCTACHGVIPYMPSDHAANVPLYAAAGLSCATLNCHESGALGVFKNIKDTHAGLAIRYVDKTIQAKMTTSAPAIDGVVESEWDNADLLVTVTGVKLKFLYDNDNLYALAQWKDGHQNYTGPALATRSIGRNRWTFDGTKWSKSGNEDRLGFIWALDDAFGASCAKTCHQTTHHTATGKMDNWHWKATRTNPVGYTDDGYWDTSGRKSDAKVSGSFGSDNIVSATSLPAKMGATPEENAADFLYASKAIDFVNTGWTAGQTLSGWIVNDTATPPIVGSQADIRSMGKFDDATGVWTVEFKRARNTGNADDALFDGSKPVQFSVTQFDNTGATHAAQGIDISVYTLEFAPSGVLANPQNGKPTEFALSQNYPNPFNPETSIKFSLKNAGRVTLLIYNSTGQVVKTLVDQDMNAGNHNISFIADGMTSGVYIYRLTVANGEGTQFQAVRKMILMK